MAKIKYKKTISESFSIIAKNPKLLIPLLISSLISIFLAPLQSKIATSSGEINTAFFSNPLNIFILVLVYIISIILGIIIYSWVFALIKNRLKKGKSDLIPSLKESFQLMPKVFLISLLIFIIAVSAMIVFGVMIGIAGALSLGSKIIGVAAIFITVTIYMIIMILFFLSIMNLIPILSLENKKALESIKKSFTHFSENKLHSLAVLGTILLIIVPVSIIIYLMQGLMITKGNLAILLTKDYNTLLISYMSSNPIPYFLITFLTSVIMIFLSMWAWMFITIAYARVKKIKIKEIK